MYLAKTYRSTPSILDAIASFAFPVPQSFRFQPQWDKTETDTGTEFYLELPGVSPDRISVETESGYLNIRVASKEDDSSTETQGKHRFKLPENSDVEGITAKLELGVLRVTVPKSADASARAIAVETVA